jgi:hypothetical protein
LFTLLLQIQEFAFSLSASDKKETPCPQFRSDLSRMRAFDSLSIHGPLAACLALLVPSVAIAAPVATRRKQEPMHQQFVVKSMDGKVVANGEETTADEGDRVRSDLTFRFLDGSLDEQVTTFTQGQVFRLINDHHVQKGPSFPNPLDITIDMPSNKVTWHDFRNGRDQVNSQHMNLPDDLANGLVPLLTENVPPGSAPLQVSWVAIAGKPLLVTLSIEPDTGGSDAVDPVEHARRYLLHVGLHGLALLVAPLIKMQPADLHVWVTDAQQPSFLRLQGPFYQAGPIWTVESIGPEIPIAAGE